MKKFAFIIVGAGTAGSMAARTAAEQGYDVCLVDQMSKEMIGDKVCGEAVGKHHFEDLGISPPKGDELAGSVIGIDVYTPDMRTVFRIQGEGLHGFMINRHEFGQRLLHEALDRGAELHDRTLALEPVIKDNRVRGVKVKDLTKNEEYAIYGDVVIDASGFAAALRKKLPPEWGVEREVRGEDVQICYREIRELATDIEDPEFSRIYLNPELSSGGYYWVFPKDDGRVNVGMGIQMTKGFPNPKKQLYDHVLSQALFRDSRVIRAGGGIVPTRRPISCMVGNGILFAGDSACQPNPIHGGGIGPSMLAGRLAVQTACKAIEDDDVCREALWPYNVEFMGRYGYKAASLDVFRIFLQKCTNEELDYGMEHRLIREEDILEASLGEDLKLNITDKARRVFKGIRKMSFLRALDKTSKNMRQIKALYQRYPEPQRLGEWVQEVNGIIQEMEGLIF